jgi:hypothetical protein
LRDIQNVIDDPARMDLILEEIDLDTPEGMFIMDIIGAIENEDDRNKLSELVRSHRVNVAKASRNGSLDAFDTVVVNEQGCIVWPLSDGVFEYAPSPEVAAITEKEIQADQPAEQPVYPPNAVPEEPAAPVEKPAPLVEEPAAAAEKPAEPEPVAEKPEPLMYRDKSTGELRPDRRKPDSKRRADLDKLEKRATVVARAYLTKLSPDKSYATGTINHVIGSFTTTMVNRAHEKGIGMSGDDPTRATLQDVVNMMLWDTASVSNVYTQRNNRKHIQRIIDKVIAESIAKEQASRARSPKKSRK